MRFVGFRVGQNGFKAGNHVQCHLCIGKVLQRDGANFNIVFRAHKYVGDNLQIF